MEREMTNEEKELQEKLLASMRKLHRGASSGNTDDVIGAAASITKTLGGDPQFTTYEEYKEWKKKGEPLKL